jgi:hypothetical protein
LHHPSKPEACPTKIKFHEKRKGEFRSQETRNKRESGVSEIVLNLEGIHIPVSLAAARELYTALDALFGPRPNVFVPTISPLRPALQPGTIWTGSGGTSPLLPSVLILNSTAT